MDELWTHLDAMFGLSRQLVLELDPRVNQAWARVLTSNVRLVDIFIPSDGLHDMPVTWRCLPGRRHAASPLRSAGGAGYRRATGGHRVVDVF